MKKIFLIATLALSGLSVLAQSYRGENDRNTKSRADILNDEYCSPLFKNADGVILDLTEDNTGAISYLNILDWMQGRVAGLQVYTLRNGLRIPYIRGSRADVFVDEMRVDAGFLNALSVSDIAIIKVIRSPFTGGIGSNSAVAIYTLRGDEEEKGN